MQSNIRTFQKESRFPLPPAPAADQSHDSKAGAAAERSSDLFIGLRQELASVFETVDGALKELERSKAALHQRTSALAVERDAHHEIKSQHRMLAAEHAQAAIEFSALQVDHSRGKAQITDLEDANASLQLSLTEKNRMIAELGRRGEAEREKIAQLSGDLKALGAHYQTAEEQIFRLGGELASTRDALAIADAETTKRDSEIADLRQHHARANRALEETEELLGAANIRLEEIASDFESKHIEQVATLGLLQAESDGRRTDVTALRSMHDAIAARAGELEQQVTALAGELLASKDAQARLERELGARAAEQAAAAARLAETLDNFSKMKQRAEKAEETGARAAHNLEDRNEVLSAAQRDLNAFRNKYEAASERIRMEGQKLEIERAAYGQNISRLNAQLEQERLARVLAESAGAAAKSQNIAQLRARPARQKPGISDGVLPPQADAG